MPGFNYQSDSVVTSRARLDSWRRLVAQEMPPSQQSWELMNQVMKQLNDPDESVRGHTALRLLAWGGEDMGHWPYIKVLERKDLLPGLRDGLVSYLDRLKWEMEQRREKHRKQEAEEAARREQAVWEGTDLH